MALDLTAICRMLSARVQVGVLSERTPVDMVSTLDDFVVIGNPAYATLVTGSPERLIARLEEEKATESAALLGAVFVCGDDEPEFAAQLAEAGMTAILGARLNGTALHATLEAFVANDHAAADRLVTASMNVLTQVARRGGIAAVIAELARRIDGWAVLLDAEGRVIDSAGAGRLHVSDAVALALGRSVRVRHPGLQLHRVGSDQDLAGSLIVATRSTRTSHARDLAELAAALFDLLLRTHNPSLTEQLGREVLLRTLLDGGESACALLRRWEVHDSCLTAVALSARSRTIDAERTMAHWFDELGAKHVYGTFPGYLLGFIRDDLASELAIRVITHSAESVQGLHLGIGESRPVNGLRQSAIQAGQALETAFEEGRAVVRYAALPSVDLVLAGLNESGGEQLVSVLDPLRDEDGKFGELAHTLRVFLGEHGAYRTSASRLGIHRQTLASRIRRIEELTELSMRSADDRAAAWVALRAAGL